MRHAALRGGDVEPGHAGTIRLRRCVVQRAGACAGRKPLSRKGRASPAAGSLPAPARTDLKHDVRAGIAARDYRPGPRSFAPSPNVFKLSGERSGAERVR